MDQAQDHVLMYVQEVEALNQLQRDSGLRWDDPHLVQRRALLGDRLKKALTSEVLDYQQPPVREEPLNAQVDQQWYITLKKKLVAYLICFLYWLLQKLIMHL